MGSSVDPPKVPAFNAVDIPAAMAQALRYDVAGFDFADSDFLARFPGLVAQRDQQIDDSYKQLTGPLDPTVEANFTRTGLQAGAGAVGGGDSLSALGMTQGSAGRNAASISFANNVLSKQDADRANFSQLLADNPQRSFGLGAGDVAGISSINTGGNNAFAQQQYQAQLAGIYGSGQQATSNAASIAALGTILARMSSYG